MTLFPSPVLSSFIFCVERKQDGNQPDSFVQQDRQVREFWDGCHVTRRLKGHVSSIPLEVLSSKTFETSLVKEKKKKVLCKAEKQPSKKEG